MSSNAQTAILLTLIMLSSGCLGFFEDEAPKPETVDCDLEPNHADCEGQVITAEDCHFNQVFTGEYCRLMTKPDNLDFGESAIELRVGEQMQSLTPSFTGDGPQNWLVNPRFPDGIEIDLDSGVISGIPLEESIETRYTIIAANVAGSSVTTLDITIFPQPPVGIQYPSDVIDCRYGRSCGIDNPIVSGGDVELWSVQPSLPAGMSIDSDGSISGTARVIGDSNHTVTASNAGGSISTILRIITVHQAPDSLSYPDHPYHWIMGESVQVIPTIGGGLVLSWTIEPPLPTGLSLHPADGSIRGTPTELHAIRTHYITASNDGGEITVSVLIEVKDRAPSNLRYSQYEFDLKQGDEIGNFSPLWSDGNPVEWAIEPQLPNGFFFDTMTGEFGGLATDLQERMEYQIWANNSGGSTSTSIYIEITSLAPDDISWPESEYILASNESVFIQMTNDGPTVETWEVHPPLPNGLTLLTNGSITGTPNERTDWQDYTIWANNTGGSIGLILTFVVHDLAADQADLLRGMTKADWGGWPSKILPIGEWAFPVGLDDNDNSVVAAAHTGKGKIVGYGHEGWVTYNHAFNLRAVEWACGENAEVGLAFGAGFDDFEDELRAEGHNVHLSVTPRDLDGLNCLLDEFWNGHDDEDNALLEEFILDGGGLVMGGHAWYWSYSNSDPAHNYPGNKIAKTTGLFVSTGWGYNDVNFQTIPAEHLTISTAVDAVLADRLDGVAMTAEEAANAYKALSDCTWIVTLDFDEFWAPLRGLINQTGYTTIPTSGGYTLGADPVADIILRLEDGLMWMLPADELPAHPSHVQFPGEVPSNATRITRTVTVNGTQPGLPGNFGYAGARSHLRMATGLYAAPGEVVTVSVDQDTANLTFYILIGAHTDGLWHKEKIHRHSRIYRSFDVDSTNIEVANAFGGPIYVWIPAGSEYGDIEVTFGGAVRAPMFVLDETTDFVWTTSERYNPAPWTEMVGHDFIMSVPSEDIRDLDNPTELMEWWDVALAMEHEVYGYEPWPRVERAVFDVQISAGWMHSGYPFMAHTASVAGVMDVEHMDSNGDWGMFHELGHNHQWMPSTLPGTTETGCNFASVYLMEELVEVSGGHGGVSPSSRNNSRSNYFEAGSNISQWSVFTALDTYLIIKDEWGWSPITEALSVYYTLPASQVPSSGDEKFNAWVLHLSNATGYNLAPYHAAWGFPLTQDTFDALDHLPVWVDDVLRGEYFSYDAMLRGLAAANVTSSAADFVWETYDNGTNTTLMLYYGTTDMGNQSLLWGNSADLGDAEVGWGEAELTGLSSSTTYHARVKSSSDGRDTWFGPISWTTTS